MAYRNLTEFIADLEADGQLVRVAAQVDPALEIAEIARRQMRSDCPEGLGGAPATDPVNGRYGGKALLFERPRGSSLPVLINAFGSYARVCQALECDSLESLAGRVAEILTPDIPAGWVAKLKKLPELARLASFAPKVVSGSPACQEVVLTSDAADLTALPALQCWPDDGAGHPDGPVARRYITFAAVLTTDPNSGTPNLGMYRLQLFGPRRCGMHIHPHHDGARHWRAWRDRGENMPAAIILGGPPVLPLAATAPLPPGIDELLFAGFCRQRGVELAPCKTINLNVPAGAEIVIEGTVSATETRLEGPFGDHTGFYSPAGEFPVFEVSAITHRRRAVFPATVVGFPPMEDYFLGKAVERIFAPALRAIVPDIIDYDLPMFGAFHNFVFVKIRKAYPYHARRVMHAIWGAGQLGLAKCIVVVDDDVNVHDPNDVWFHVGANVDPTRDLEITRGPLDILDHAAIAPGAGGKLGIDATRKLPGEGPTRPFPNPSRMTADIIDLVTRRWADYGLT